MSLKFSKEHEWINVANLDLAPVGITNHAQETLGDVVFVELPQIGQSFKQGEIAGVVESTKAASDMFMPVDGEIVEINENLQNDPNLANSSPENDGWFFKIKITNSEQLNDLMNESDYQNFTKES